VKQRIDWRPEAHADIEESAVFIGDDAPDVALRFLDAVEATVRRVAKNPAIGAGRDFARSELTGLRFFAVKGFTKYLIFYRPIPNGIEVVRVLHGARDLGELFGG